MDSNQQEPFESDGSKLAETLLDPFRKLNDRFWCELTCKDLWDCYHSYSEGLKEFRGTSAGFTGLTELLVFRCLYSQLTKTYGCVFTREKISRALSRFSDSRPETKVVLGQNQPVCFDGRKRYPDVVVYKGDDLLAVVQVKVYITNGLGEVRHELKTLDALRKKHGQMQALLAVYSSLPSGGPDIYPELMRAQEKRKGWFDFRSLADSDDKMADVLTKTLGLERLRPRTGGA